MRRTRWKPLMGLAVTGLLMTSPSLVPSAGADEAPRQKLTTRDEAEALARAHTEARARAQAQAQAQAEAQARAQAARASRPDVARALRARSRSTVVPAQIDRNRDARRYVVRRPATVYGGAYEPWPYWASDPWYGQRYPTAAYSYYPVERPIPADVAAVELNVKPKKADVYVDGRLVGEARDFDDSNSPLWLTPGTHDLELVSEGYLPLRTVVSTQGGQGYSLHFELSEE